MLYQVYTVRDKLAEESGPPFIAVNDKVAMRQYKAMNIPDSLKNEYELLMIGYFDSVDTTITPSVVYDVVESPEVANG